MIDPQTLYSCQTECLFFPPEQTFEELPNMFRGNNRSERGTMNKTNNTFPFRSSKKKKKSVDKTVSITACMLYKCVSRIIFTKTCLLVVLNNNGIQFYIILLTNGQRHHEFLLFTNYKEQVCLCFHSYFYT